MSENLIQSNSHANTFGIEIRRPVRNLFENSHQKRNRYALDDFGLTPIKEENSYLTIKLEASAAEAIKDKNAKINIVKDSNQFQISYEPHRIMRFINTPHLLLFHFLNNTCHATFHLSCQSCIQSIYLHL